MPWICDSASFKSIGVRRAVVPGVLHIIHRGVESGEKNCCRALDIFDECCMITDGSALPKGVGPCRGFTVGSEVIQGTDPIVRRLISTG